MVEVSKHSRMVSEMMTIRYPKTLGHLLILYKYYSNLKVDSEVIVVAALMTALVVYWTNDQIVQGRPANQWIAKQSLSRRRNYATGSSINSGDTGIFVTCDKGNEKRSLDEMENLLTEYMGLDSEEGPTQTEVGDATPTQDSIMESASAPQTTKGSDIENDILAELAGMKGSRPTKQTTGCSSNKSHSDLKHKNLILITLDIPCVSFVRFPPHSLKDAVKIVHRMCTDAAANPDRPRSRFIKRLTPVTMVRKVMNHGIEQLCDEILPSHFGREQQTQVIKYAIRPTTRNNSSIDRDQLIKSIADKVSALGDHKVDLKSYDKLVLVDIYRNICGMSVVGSDYETLKRYNLAEIYAEGRSINESSTVASATAG